MKLRLPHGMSSLSSSSITHDVLLSPPSCIHSRLTFGARLAFFLLKISQREPDYKTHFLVNDEIVSTDWLC